MEGGRDTNYWPGFVDALTNVVIAMVFVIIVLAIALTFIAQKITKNTVAELEAKHQTELAAKDAQIRQVCTPSSGREGGLSAAAPGGSDLDKKTKVEVAGADTKPQEGGPSIQKRGNYISIEYTDNSIELDATGLKAFDGALAPTKASLASTLIDIQVFMPSSHLSENQRLGLLRAIAVRNYLLERGAQAKNIKLRMDETNRSGKNAVVNIAFASGG